MLLSFHDTCIVAERVRRSAPDRAGTMWRRNVRSGGPISPTRDKHMPSKVIAALETEPARRSPRPDMGEVRNPVGRDVEKQRLEKQIRQANDALEATRSELQKLSQQFITAQEDERRRISRDLHDDLGQQAALLGIRLDELVNTAPPEIRGTLVEIRDQMAEFSGSLRKMSHQLHPSMLEDLGLHVALDSLVEDYRQAGMPICISPEPVAYSIPLSAATALYRVAQEALSNAARHARGSDVYLALKTFDNELRLIIRDSGPGFSLGDVRHTSGLGLLSMQERVRLAGGTLYISAKPGNGTLVLVRMPFSGSS